MINTRTPQIDRVNLIAFRDAVDVEIGPAELNKAAHPVAICVVRGEDVARFSGGGVLGECLDGYDEAWF